MATTPRKRAKIDRRSVGVMLRRVAALVALAFAATAERRPRVLEDPPAVPREFRAAWSTPIWDRGLRDWPSASGLSPDSQRAELRAMLDHASSVGLNAILLHVRIAGDAMYPTKYAPWSAYLSGTSGLGPNPSYDPLQFAVEEAHARGIQLHAWFNPFRAMMPIFAGKASSVHVTRTHPEWIRKYGTQTWIDPGEPAARKWVLETMLDVVKRYDVDGIHIDDYFYPYRESRVVTRRVKKKRVRTRVEIPFPDDRTWKKYGRAAGFTDRDSWRRANIDDFVKKLYTEVKAIKPTMLVGISPFGIWRPGSPPGVTGLDSYAEIYADSRRWLREGWLDYIAPQIYWQVGGEQDRFRLLDAWWRSENPQGRYIFPGLYTSHVWGGSDPWPMDAIQTQITTLRNARVGNTDVVGHVHFRLAALFSESDRLAATLAGLYAERAIPPAYPWLDATVPAPPAVELVRGDSVTRAASFTVAPGDSTAVRWWLIQTRGRDGVWTTSLRARGEGSLGAFAFGTNDPDEIAVTAISPSGMASSATLIAP
jgi:uncharacterized lipoprotein YddW (UPF0748 family)